MKTSEILILFCFLSLLLMILGLIRPKLVLFFSEVKTRGRVLAFYLTLSIVFFFYAGTYGLEEEKENPSKEKIAELAKKDSLEQKENENVASELLANEKKATRSSDELTKKINANRKEDDFKDPDKDGFWDFAKRQTLGSDWGEKVSYDDSDLFYSSSIEEEEAIRLRDYLVKVKLLSGQGASLHIRYNNRIEDPKFELRIVTNYESKPDSAMINIWKLYAASVSHKVFDNAPVNIHLCDDHFKTIEVVQSGT